MDVHSLNKAIAAAMHEVLPPGKTLMDGSYLDKESDAIRFVTWALRRLTPEQAARLPDMAETCVGHPIQSSLLLFFPEILDYATKLSVADERKIGRGKQRQ